MNTRVAKVVLVQQMILLLVLALRWWFGAGQGAITWGQAIMLGALALLSLSFTEVLLDCPSQWGKRAVQVSWLLLTAGLMAHGFWREGSFVWSLGTSSTLVAWLVTASTWHLYKTPQSRILVLLSFLSVSWATGLVLGVHFLVLFLLHAGSALWMLARARIKLWGHEPLPLVWQSVLMYGLWVWVGTAISLAVGGEEIGFNYEVAALPAIILIIWSLRHSLLRDETARGLSHFGVILVLAGAVAGAINKLAPLVAVEQALEAQAPSFPMGGLVVAGAVLIMVGSVLVLVVKE